MAAELIRAAPFELALLLLAGLSLGWAVWLLLRWQHVDWLTGLPNRHRLEHMSRRRLAAACAACGGACVLVVDLDRFQMINDSYGYHVGDGVLALVARKLKRESSRLGGVAARLSVDEFLLLLPIADPHQAESVARKLLVRLAEPCLVGGRTITVSAGIGISMCPADGEELAVLAKRANTALAIAKKAGRSSCCLYEFEMEERAMRRAQLAQGLCQAIEKSEFLLHYQPKYQLRSGRLLGVEALIRWHHPQLGMISPGEFIPLAEEDGSIVQLGEWIIRTACRQNQAWRLAGLPPIKMAVNMSILQLQQPNLRHMLASILRETGLSPDGLELEITESIAIANLEDIAGKLLPIRELGVGILIDDFGTGYSTLRYLGKLPIDTLKIDRTFIMHVPESRTDTEILKAIFYLAKSLGLNVLAEGIENEAQLQFLREQSCNEGQGFLLAKPLSADEIGLMLRERAKAD